MPPGGQTPAGTICYFIKIYYLLTAIFTLYISIQSQLFKGRFSKDGGKLLADLMPYLASGINIEGM